MLFILDKNIQTPKKKMAASGTQCFVFLTTAILTIGMAVPHTTIAETIIVDTINDELNADGDCSLREAIQSANQDTAIDNCFAGNGADVINFKPSILPGIFSLNIEGTGEDDAFTGDLDIIDDLIIKGQNVLNTIIDANKIDRVFHVIGAVTVHFEDLTIQNGFVKDGLAGGGGGIVIYGGSLELKNCIVKDNAADFGGGIVNEFSLVNIVNTTITTNTAIRTGSGISNRGGTLEISDSTINGNAASLEGGGISNTFNGNVVLRNSTISGNTAHFGGGINNDTGSLSIVNCTITENMGGNTGGGIGAGSGPVELQNTILAKNTANYSPDCGFSRRVTSLGNNLIGDNTRCDIVPGPNDVIPEPGNIIDPRLGDFVDDGIPGRGHYPLLTGSPAIDAANNEVCPDKDQLGNSRFDGDNDGLITCDIGAIEFQGEELVVDINIKPLDFCNIIIPHSRGGIWVAVLSDGEFDPLKIKKSTVCFGPNCAKAIRFKVRDINKDGYRDLLLRFRIRATGIKCGDTDATLTGKTFDGQSFTGTDQIITRGCKYKN
jgi:CSLREA domain-containing protein